MRISDWSSDVCSSDLRDERLQGHIVTPAPTTERLLSIQRMVADQLGDKLPDFEVDALRAIPVQAGGLYPISDVWYIEPGMAAPDRLREIGSAACRGRVGQFVSICVVAGSLKKK